MPLRGRSFRGFPFDEEEGSGAWSELAARHPDIAARLRQRPATATWARKRRPASQDNTDDFGESFGGFDRFPFDDIPPEFREHFPTHWSRHYSPRDEPAPPAEPQAPPPPPPPAQHTTAATQTEHEPEHAHEQSLPQYGLRNTVDLGQKSPADPSLVDAEERSQRSVSAPPDARPAPAPDMSANHEQQHAAPPEHASNVRHIPIFVEGRDEPVINKAAEPSAHYEPKPQHAPPPHIDRDQYFADDGPHGFHHTPNFSRAFGTPFNKGFRQGPQPFTQQKAYPQNAFARGASPQRAHSPKQPPHDEFVKVPVHHDHAATQHKQPSPQPQQQHQQHQQQQPQHQPQPQQQREQTPPRPQPTSNDPITQILSIQTDVLNLMTEVENFKGTKKDKRYLFLDEMLTRNLIKLDNIETEGKENIRLARKEAIRCIQKCIAVLEAKAEGNAAANAAGDSAASPAPGDVDMPENAEPAPGEHSAPENGEVEMKDAPKEPEKVETQAEPQRIDEQATQEQKVEDKKESTPKPQDKTEAQKPEENADTQPPAADTRPDETKTEEKTDEQKVENKPSPKKKVVKKRDKSKDTKAAKEGDKEASKDSNKTETQEAMQVDDKGDKAPQVMEIDGAASQ